MFAPKNWWWVSKPILVIDLAHCPTLGRSIYFPCSQLQCAAQDVTMSISALFRPSVYSPFFTLKHSQQDFSPLFPKWFISVSQVFNQCFTSVLPVFHQCFTSVSPVFHKFLTIISQVFYQCFISVSPVSYQVLTIVSPVYHHCFTTV